MYDNDLLLYTLEANSSYFIWPCQQRLKKDVTFYRAHTSLGVQHKTSNAKCHIQLIGKDTRYHFSAYAYSERNEKIKSALLQYIPTDTKVAVSSQNTVNWGHLSHRNDYFPFPIGICEPRLKTYNQSALSIEKNQESNT